VAGQGQGEESRSGVGSVVAGSVVALLLAVAVIYGVRRYYIKRFNDLKTELSHVKYTVEPDVSPGEI